VSPATVHPDWPQSVPGYTKWVWLYGVGQAVFASGVVCLGSLSLGSR
jgi:hypothetical protein